MPPSMPCPSIRIPIEALSQTAFSQFGTVIENPAHSSSTTPSQHAAVESANQGTALKFLNVTPLTNHYPLAPSTKPAAPAVNMFVCAPRDLRPHEPSTSLPSSWGDIDLDAEDDDDDDAVTNKERELFDVSILERHPFTTQTFIPMGLGLHERHTQYLVIVAPTLPAAASRKNTDRPPPYPTPKVDKKKKDRKSIFSRARPSPFTNEAAPPPSRFSKLPPQQRPKGPGLPDLKNLRAFVANGGQAVTYGAGTWHAPMVVLGQRAIDFVVFQYANGVGIEDCQEVLLKHDEGAEEGVVVLVDSDASGKVLVKAGAGAVRAKL